jgi:hypothetical protein
VFAFSLRWFRAFLRRYGISLRRITRKAQKQPEQYQNMYELFLQFIRRVSIAIGKRRFCNSDGRCLVDDKIRRFELYIIANIDETSIPFEFLDRCTYDLVGTFTINGKSDKSGWNKR